MATRRRNSAPPEPQVPVHATETEAFLSCRLRWFWSAPAPRGMYLEPTEPAEALAFGLSIHAGLQSYYDKTEEPQETFTRTLAKSQGGYQWGFLTGEPDVHTQKLLDLGYAMLDGYAPYARKADRDWNVLAAETEWATELGPGLPIAGRFDLVVEDYDGAVWPVDFKTTSSPSPDWAEDSVQGMMYVSAARRLYGENVAGIIFRFLRKKMPESWDSLILKSGKLTEKASLTSSTTYTEYLRALSVLAAMQVWECGSDEAHYKLTEGRSEWFESEVWKQFEAYYHAAQIMHRGTLEKLLSSDAFFWDVKVPVSIEQQATNERLLLAPTVRTMLSKPFVAPTGLGSAWALCRRCQFRFPCAAFRRGDKEYAKELLRTNFRVRAGFEEGDDE